MDTSELRRKRLKALIDEKLDGKQAEAAKRLGLEPSYVSRLLYTPDKAGSRKIGDKLREKIEKEFSVPKGWLDGLVPLQGNLSLVSSVSATLSGFSVEQGQPGQAGAFEIPYWDARGSCGGGAFNQEQPPKGMLIKEQGWFDRFDCKPGDCLVVYADGDSMADFICDGDMVFFNKSKTTPKSGKVYLIQHPDGLRIKQLRREIDGTWVLESRNPDKRRYPDERIPPSHSDLLVIVGEQFYRQG